MAVAVKDGGVHEEGDLAIWDTRLDTVRWIRGPETKQRRDRRISRNQSFMRGFFSKLPEVEYHRLFVADDGNSLVLLTADEGAWLWVLMGTVPAPQTGGRRGGNSTASGMLSRWVRLAELDAGTDSKSSDIKSNDSKRNDSKGTNSAAKDALPLPPPCHYDPRDPHRFGSLTAAYTAEGFKGAGWRITHAYPSTSRGTPCNPCSATGLTVWDMFLSVDTTASAHGTGNWADASTPSLATQYSCYKHYREICGSGRLRSVIRRATLPLRRGMFSGLTPEALERGLEAWRQKDPFSDPGLVRVAWDAEVELLAVVINTPNNTNASLFYLSFLDRVDVAPQGVSAIHGEVSGGAERKGDGADEKGAAYQKGGTADAQNLVPWTEGVGDRHIYKRVELHRHLRSANARLGAQGKGSKANWSDRWVASIDWVSGGHGGSLFVALLTRASELLVVSRLHDALPVSLQGRPGEPSFLMQLSWPKIIAGAHNFLVASTNAPVLYCSNGFSLLEFHVHEIDKPNRLVRVVEKLEKRLGKVPLLSQLRLWRVLLSISSADDDPSVVQMGIHVASAIRGEFARLDAEDAETKRGGRYDGGLLIEATVQLLKNLPWATSHQVLLRETVAIVGCAADHIGSRGLFIEAFHLLCAAERQFQFTYANPTPGRVSRKAVPATDARVVFPGARQANTFDPDSILLWPAWDALRLRVEDALEKCAAPPFNSGWRERATRLYVIASAIRKLTDGGHAMACAGPVTALAPDIEARVMGALKQMLALKFENCFRIILSLPHEFAWAAVNVVLRAESAETIGPWVAELREKVEQFMASAPRPRAGSTRARRNLAWSYAALIGSSALGQQLSLPSVFTLPLGGGGADSSSYAQAHTRSGFAARTVKGAAAASGGARASLWDTVRGLLWSRDIESAVAYCQAAAAAGLEQQSHAAGAHDMAAALALEYGGDELPDELRTEILDAKAAVIASSWDLASALALIRCAPARDATTVGKRVLREWGTRAVSLASVLPLVPATRGDAETKSQPPVDSAPALAGLEMFRFPDALNAWAARGGALYQDAAAVVDAVRKMTVALCFAEEFARLRGASGDGKEADEGGDESDEEHEDPTQFGPERWVRRIQEWLWFFKVRYHVFYHVQTMHGLAESGGSLARGSNAARAVEWAVRLLPIAAALSRRDNKRTLRGQALVLALMAEAPTSKRLVELLNLHLSPSKLKSAKYVRAAHQRLLNRIQSDSKAQHAAIVNAATEPRFLLEARPQLSATDMKKERFQGEVGAAVQKLFASMHEAEKDIERPGLGPIQGYHCMGDVPAQGLHRPHRAPLLIKLVYHIRQSEAEWGSGGDGKWGSRRSPPRVATLAPVEMPAAQDSPLPKAEPEGPAAIELVEGESEAAEKQPQKEVAPAAAGMSRSDVEKMVKDLMGQQQQRPAPAPAKPEGKAEAPQSRLVELPARTERVKGPHPTITRPRDWATLRPLMSARLAQSGPANRPRALPPLRGGFTGRAQRGNGGGALWSTSERVWSTEGKEGRLGGSGGRVWSSGRPAADPIASSSVAPYLIRSKVASGTRPADSHSSALEGPGLWSQASSSLRAQRPPAARPLPGQSRLYRLPGEGEAERAPVAAAEPGKAGIGESAMERVLALLIEERREDRKRLQAILTSERDAKRSGEPQVVLVEAKKAPAQTPPVRAAPPRAAALIPVPAGPLSPAAETPLNSPTESKALAIAAPEGGGAAVEAEVASPRFMSRDRSEAAFLQRAKELLSGGDDHDDAAARAGIAADPYIAASSSLVRCRARRWAALSGGDDAPYDFAAFESWWTNARASDPSAGEAVDALLDAAMLESDVAEEAWAQRLCTGVGVAGAVGALVRMRHVSAASLRDALAESKPKAGADPPTALRCALPRDVVRRRFGLGLDILCRVWELECVGAEPASRGALIDVVVLKEALMSPERGELDRLGLAASGGAARQGAALELFRALDTARVGVVARRDLERVVQAMSGGAEAAVGDAKRGTEDKVGCDEFCGAVRGVRGALVAFAESLPVAAVDRITRAGESKRASLGDAVARYLAPLDGAGAEGCDPARAITALYVAFRSVDREGGGTADKDALMSALRANAAVEALFPAKNHRQTWRRPLVSYEHFLDRLRKATGPRPSFGEFVGVFLQRASDTRGGGLRERLRGAGADLDRLYSVFRRADPGGNGVAGKQVVCKALVEFKTPAAGGRAAAGPAVEGGAPSLKRQVALESLFRIVALVDDRTRAPEASCQVLLTSLLPGWAADGQRTLLAAAGAASEGGLVVRERFVTAVAGRLTHLSDTEFERRVVSARASLASLGEEAARRVAVALLEAPGYIGRADDVTFGELFWISEDVGDSGWSGQSRAPVVREADAATPRIDLGAAARAEAEGIVRDAVRQAVPRLEDAKRSGIVGSRTAGTLYIEPLRSPAKSAGKPRDGGPGARDGTRSGMSQAYNTVQELRASYLSALVKLDRPAQAAPTPLIPAVSQTPASNDAKATPSVRDSLRDIFAPVDEIGLGERLGGDEEVNKMQSELAGMDADLEGLESMLQEMGAEVATAPPRNTAVARRPPPRAERKSQRAVVRASGPPPSGGAAAQFLKQIHSVLGKGARGGGNAGLARSRGSSSRQIVKKPPLAVRKRAKGAQRKDKEDERIAKLFEKAHAIAQNASRKSTEGRAGRGSAGRYGNSSNY